MPLRINIVYLSQTGNTEKVAVTMKDVFLAAGSEPRIFSLENADPIAAADCDALAIGTPCFMSAAPTPVLQFLHKMPNLEDKPVFVFATSSGAPGRVLLDLKTACESKAGRVLGGILVRGECHYPVPCLLGRFPTRPDENDLDRARKFAATFHDHIKESKSTVLLSGDPDLVNGKTGFYGLVGRMLSDSTCRLLLPSPKATQAKCTKCGICAKHCPTDSIGLKPFPEISNSCIRCYRCIVVCHDDAMRTNILWANLATLSLYSVTFELLFGDIKKGEQIYPSKD